MLLLAILEIRKLYAVIIPMRSFMLGFGFLGQIRLLVACSRFQIFSATVLFVVYFFRKMMPLD